MFRLDNEAIMEAKDPLLSRKYETSALSGLRRANDVMVWKRGRLLGKRGLPSSSVLIPPLFLNA